jgi:hypothetical protein
MTPRQQSWNDAAADIAGSSGNKDLAAHYAPPMPILRCKNRAGFQLFLASTLSGPYPASADIGGFSETLNQLPRMVLQVANIVKLQLNLVEW